MENKFGMNYVQSLKAVEDKLVEFIEETGNKLVGTIEFNEEEQYVKFMVLTNYKYQSKFEREWKLQQALEHPYYCGKELRELVISFKLNEKFRFDPMQWTYADKEKTLSMKNFEEGFEDFLIANVKGYKQDLEARHDANHERIEEDIERK